jgi:hypothetical protein
MIAFLAQQFQLRDYLVFLTKQGRFADEGLSQPDFRDSML